MLSTLPTANQLRTETDFSRYLEDWLYDEIARRPDVHHVVLVCAAVNYIDASALDSLEVIVDRLKQAGVSLNLSEVKGPMLDRLQRSEFLQHLTGSVFLSQHQAMSTLDSEVTAGAAAGLKQVAAEA
jgi:sulfate permease, SulP family